jgi:hypothetical protein
VGSLRVHARVAPFALGGSIGWIRRIDSTSFRIYIAGRVKRAGDIGCMRPKFTGTSWPDMMREEPYALSGDYEAEVGQSVIMLHSDEHLAGSDSGIAVLHGLLRRQIHVVAQGTDPAGVNSDPDATPIVFEAGDYLPNQ